MSTSAPNSPVYYGFVETAFSNCSTSSSFRALLAGVDLSDTKIAEIIADQLGKRIEIIEAVNIPHKITATPTPVQSRQSTFTGVPPAQPAVASK